MKGLPAGKPKSGKDSNNSSLMRSGARSATYLLWDMDRFSRFPALEANHYWYLLDSAGVRIVTVNQGELDFSVLANWLSASIAQHGKAEYVKDLSRNTLWGKISAAQNGDWGSLPPMGYRVENRRLVLGDPREIETIRRIFRLCIEGNSLRGIADLFNREGTLTPKGNNWTADTVRKKLRNPAYMGTVAWNRNSQGKFHQVLQASITVRPSDRFHENDQSEWIVRENMHEPLVSRETFERAQEVMQGRAKRRTPHLNGGKFVLSGQLWCSHCGNKFVGRTVGGIIYYTCGGYQNKGGSVCYSFNVPQARLVDILVEHIDEQLLKPKSIKKLRAALRRGVKEHKRQLDLPGLKRELRRIDQKLEKATRRRLEIDADMIDTVQGAIRTLREDRDRLRDDVQLAEMPEKRLKSDQDKIVDRAIENLSRLRETLKEADPVQVRKLFEQLFSRIDLYFDRKRQGKRAKHHLRRIDVAIKADWFSSNLSPVL